MKKLSALLFACLVFTAITAQKVDVDGDVITVDGTPYATLKKISKGFELGEFSLQTNDGVEVAVAKVDPAATLNNGNTQTTYIHITFLNRGQQASMLYGLGFKKQLAKEVVKCKLFDGGNYNAEGEKKFIILNPYKPMGAGNTVVIQNNNGLINDTQQYTPAYRSRGGMVQVFKNTIKQSGVEIGTVNEFEDIDGGSINTRYIFFLPNGTQIADATIVGATGKMAILHTYLDGRSHSIDVRIKINGAEEIAEYLVKNNYL